MAREPASAAPCLLVYGWKEKLWMVLPVLHRWAVSSWIALSVSLSLLLSILSFSSWHLPASRSLALSLSVSSIQRAFFKHCSNIV